MKRYVKSTAVDAKSALSQFDPIRKLLGEKEWYTIEEYLLNGDKKYSLKDILYDEEAWDAYADWKMKKYHEKPSIAASTRIKARRYLTASTEIAASIDSDINRYKKSLAQKAAKSGIYENFGAAEIRKLRDKYSVYQDDTTDYRTAEHNRRSIDSFEDWCMNYVGASTCVKASASYDIEEPAQSARLSRSNAAKSKSNKELLDQYVLLVATGSNDEQAKEILYDEILSRMS